MTDPCPTCNATGWRPAGRNLAGQRVMHPCLCVRLARLEAELDYRLRLVYLRTLLCLESWVGFLWFDEPTRLEQSPGWRVGDATFILVPLLLPAPAPEMLALAGRAIARQESLRHEDLDAWAERLAADVADAND